MSIDPGEKGMTPLASAPAWVQALVDAADAAEAGDGGTISQVAHDSAIDAISRLIEMTGYHSMTVVDRNVSHDYQDMLDAAMPSQRARLQFAATVGAATMAAAGTTDAHSKSPRAGIAARNLALTLIAAAAASGE